MRYTLYYDSGTDNFTKGDFASRRLAGDAKYKADCWNIGYWKVSIIPKNER